MTPSSRVFRALASFFLYKMTFLCIVFKDRRCRFSAVCVAVLATTLMIIAPPPQTVNPFFASFLLVNSTRDFLPISSLFPELSPFFALQPSGFCGHSFYIYRSPPSFFFRTDADLFCISALNFM